MGASKAGYSASAEFQGKANFVQIRTYYDNKCMLSPRGVGVEHWPCNPRVSGSIPGTGNLKKLFIWMKIHGHTQKS